MRRSALIDDFIEENDLIFVVLVCAPEKTEKRHNKILKIGTAFIKR
jgi:hypothetical protein